MNIEILRKEWLDLTKKYSHDLKLIDLIWFDIQKNYNQKNRKYHNLQHIQSMLIQAKENSSNIINLDVIKFSIWFHDIIYKATSNKNEEKSADLAGIYLKKIGLETSNIQKIYQLIISTKKHQVIVNDIDNSFLLDFDLSILGNSWETYQTYIKNIRREYKIYPDFVYNPGRIKVLQHFLKRDNLYFTKQYQDLYEKQARQNILKELELLK